MAGELAASASTMTGVRMLPANSAGARAFLRSPLRSLKRVFTRAALRERRDVGSADERIGRALVGDRRRGRWRRQRRSACGDGGVVGLGGACEREVRRGVLVAEVDARLGGGRGEALGG